MNRTCVAVFAFFLAVELCPGGGTPEEALLIVDPAIAESMYVANYYMHARQVPDESALFMAPTSTPFAEFLGANLPAFLGELTQKSLNGQIDYVILPSGGPYRIGAAGYVTDTCVAVEHFSASTLYSLAYVVDDILAGPSSRLSNRYSRVDEQAIAFSSSTWWYAGLPDDPSNTRARRYHIGAMLGYTGERGNTLDEVLAMIDRSIAVDGTFPAGTFYFMETTDDIRSDPRDGYYTLVAGAIIADGGQAEHLMAVLPTGRHDCLGIMTGAANPDIDGTDMTILPGAFCDHLTSYAGFFDIASQTKMSRWIARGASGSFGTVEEPCNYAVKFPHARLHHHYFLGLSLGEAWFRSMRAVPFQGLFLGDPLTRPFTFIPSVQVPDAPTDPVGGVISITPIATTGRPDTTVSRVRVLIDGRPLGDGANGASSAIDTTSLADGWHDLRVLAYDDTPIRATGRWIGSLLVDNHGLSATASARTTAGDLATPFIIDVGAGGGQVSEIRLLAHGRVVAATAAASAALTVYGQNVGAGPVRLIAEAEFADGRRARSEPVELDVAYDPGSPGPAAPQAFSYTRTVRNDAPFLVELPTAFDTDPAGTTYTIVSGPAQSTVATGFGSSYRLLTPDPGASGVDSLTFRADSPGGQSTTATVTIAYAAPACPPDLNGDGLVNSQDFIIFLNAFVAGDPTADFNGDGLVNSQDFIAFLNAFVAGC